MQPSESSPALPSGLKQRQQQSWAAGDFSKVGAAAVIVGEMLCEAIRLRAGERVLDVATGAGSTAIAAARRSTDVVGVDFVPALLERARERAHAERLHRVSFELGDTEALPFPDHSFDVVLSTFGHMFAPEPEKAVAEMARVARLGGRVGFTAWTPEGFNGSLFRINAKYSPPPAGLAVPVQWGVEDVVWERFAAHAASYQFERKVLMIRAPSPQDWLAHMREFFGPIRVAWERLDNASREALTIEILELIAGYNQSGDETMLVPAEYLESLVGLVEHPVQHY